MKILVMMKMKRKVLQVTHKEEWVLLVVIAKRAHKKSIVKRLYELEAAMVTKTLVHGSAKEGFLRALGLTREDSQMMLNAFIKVEKVSELFTFLNDVHHFNKPNSGFAFTIPVEKISY